MRFRPGQVTTVGQRPVLSDGEIILHLQPQIGLYDKEDRLDQYGNGTGYLTNQRFIWCDANGGKALYIPLFEIATIDGQAGFLASHAKIILRLLPTPTSLSGSAVEITTTIKSSKVEWICPICDTVDCLPLDVGEAKCKECGVKTLLDRAILVCHACTFHNQPGSRRSALQKDNNLSCEMCGTEFLISSQSLLPSQPSVPSRSDASPHVAINEYVKLSFRAGGQPLFLQRIREAHKSKGWLATSSSPPSLVSDTSAFNPLSAGISGIVKNVAELQLQTERSLEGAFRDLDALIREAEEMVALADALSSKLKESVASGSKDSTDATEFQMLMLNIGISNPVTKEIAGSLYHHELARQLSDFLDKLLPQTGGMIPLTDIYCIFNRARGVALISPEDLFKACVEFERLQLPMKLHRFNSGLLVVKSDRYSEHAIMERVMAYLCNSPFITCVELADMDRISSALAFEQLLTIERMAKICRDESVEGLRFYRNEFLTQI